MTCDALIELEDNLEVKLPQEYLDVFKSYPFADGHFGIEMLSDDAQILARHNRPTVTKQAKKRFRPSLADGYFWIGSDGGELDFYVKLGRESRGVWYYDIETDKIQKYCDDVGDYLQKCRKVDADEERLPNESSSWPLWKQNLYAFALLAGFILFGYIVFLATRWSFHYFGLI